MICESRTSDQSESLIQEITTRYILHWNYRGYEQIPEVLLQHGSHIQDIYFKENGLRDIPDNFDVHMKELTNLYLHGNQLKTFPLSLTRVNHLTVLEISRNRIKTLPKEIGNLKLLETLDLSNNYLETLPETIGNLTNLQYLIVIRNDLRTIPASIGKLKNLVCLHLAANELSFLPEEISNCVKLIDIYVGCNKLKYLPTSLTNLPRLSHLNVSSNRLECLPLLPFISLPRVTFDANAPIQEIPFLFGCQQNHSSQLQRLLQQPNQDDHDAPEIKWKFQNHGCFKQIPGKASYDKSRPLLCIVKTGNYAPTVIKFSSKIKEIQTYDVVTGEILTNTIRKVWSLKELSTRVLYAACFKPDYITARSIDSKNWIYIRKQPTLTTYGIMINGGYYLTIELQAQIFRQGPTTFCCNPLCSGPIFSSCDVIVTKFLLTHRREVIEHEQGPHLTTLYFCGPWCIKYLMETQNEECLYLSYSLRSCDVYVRSLSQ